MVFDQRKINEDNFLEKFNELNESQKNAVKQLDGPVLVLAGPGTGKTQLLALRVCNILRETDMLPQNILCLTYTDAGANEMRNRLVKFMGPDAYQVGIYTYHSFCNKIIRENSEYFGQLKELSNADELEAIECVLEVINSLPLDHPLKKNTGDTDYHLEGLMKVFDTMKKEGWTANDIENAYYMEEEKFRAEPSSYYSKTQVGKYKKGDFKEHLFKSHMDKLKVSFYGSRLIGLYNDALLKRNRIDYNDTINLVNEELAKNQDLKWRYQEQFQYILADEYQDTNGTQNNILFQLADYDERPNLFVVGDDDQSIYRFQGASMKNIKDFKEILKPAQFVLDYNYRSFQPILDKSMLLINNNAERLSADDPSLKKILKQGKVATSSEDHTPQVIKYANAKAQDIGVIAKIEKLYSEGVLYKDIAVIYRKHKEVANIVKFLTKKNIPLSVKKKVNVLTQPDAKKLITLLTYANGEFKYKDSQRQALFEILHYDFFGLSPEDIGKLAVYCSKRQDEEAQFESWRSIMHDEEKLNEIGISDKEGFKKVHNILEQLIQSIGNHTPQIIFEKTMTITGFTDELLKSGERTWRLQVVNKLFDFIKDETAKNGDFTMSNILTIIDNYKEYGIEITITNIMSNSEGINFISGHSAKGLEFKHVFILNATEKGWVKGNSNNIKFPSSLLSSSGEGTIEDDRRLFYVAITRAMDHCYINVPMLNEDNKSNGILRFITEMGYDLEAIEEEKINETMVDDYVSTILSFENKMPVLIDKSIIDSVFNSMTINSTGVSKYLECQIKFYFENILRVPLARKAGPGYGNALHYALDQFSREMEAVPGRTVPPLSSLLFHFAKGMNRFRSHFTQQEFDEHMHEGNQTLEYYYNNSKSAWTLPVANKTEYRIHTNINDIPISGIIDKIAVFDDHIVVYDYKTGKYNSAKISPASHDKAGGEYWRQAVFYKILLDQDIQYKGKYRSTKIVYLQKDSAELEKEINVDDKAVEAVKEQINTVYNGIKNYQFSEGCLKCEWCAFVNETMGIDKVLEAIEIASEDESSFEEEIDFDNLSFDDLF